jgi:signal peptidase
MKQRFFRAAGFLGSTLAVLVMLASIAFIAPSLFGYERYVITGGSMSGTFEKGSVVFEKVVPVTALEVGDIITYQPPASSGLDNLVSHRLITITHQKNGAVVYHTKGDANPAPDPWKFQLGATTQPVVVAHVPMAGYLFLAMSDRDTRMLIIGVPAGVIALYSLVELVGALRDPGSEGTAETEPESMPVAKASPDKPRHVLVGV